MSPIVMRFAPGTAFKSFTTACAFASCPLLKICIVQEIHGVSLIVRVGHVHFRGFRRRSHAAMFESIDSCHRPSRVKICDGMCIGVRGSGANFAYMRGGYQAFASKFGSIARMNDVVATPGCSGSLQVADRELREHSCGCQTLFSIIR